MLWPGLVFECGELVGGVSLRLSNQVFSRGEIASLIKENRVGGTLRCACSQRHLLCHVRAWLFVSLFSLQSSASKFMLYNGQAEYACGVYCYAMHDGHGPAHCHGSRNHYQVTTNAKRLNPGLVPHPPLLGLLTDGRLHCEYGLDHG